MPPKRITLQDLEELACRAAQEQSTATGHRIDCEVLGQPFGPARNRQYRKNPDVWKIPSGSRHSLQTVAFQWLINADYTLPMVTESRCNHATTRGLKPPQQVTDMIGTNLEKMLRESGSAAARARSTEWGIQCSCKYMGQQFAQDPDVYEPTPSKWNVAEGGKAIDQAVVFKWVTAGLFEDRLRFYQAAASHFSHNDVTLRSVRHCRPFTGADVVGTVTCVVRNVDLNGVRVPHGWPEQFDMTLSMMVRAREAEVRECNASALIPRKPSPWQDRCIQGHQLALEATTTSRAHEFGDGVSIGRNQ